jgi:hypothetical protein
MTKAKRATESVPLEEGALVRITGDRGSYVVMSSALAPDGSVTLYGGDVDPNGHRSYRSVMPNRIVPEDRKTVLSKRKRQDV